MNEPECALVVALRVPALTLARAPLTPLTSTPTLALALSLQHLHKQVSFQVVCTLFSLSI